MPVVTYFFLVLITRSFFCARSGILFFCKSRMNYFVVFSIGNSAEICFLISILKKLFCLQTLSYVSAF